MRIQRSCNYSVAAATGPCHFRSSVARMTSREAAAECSLPLVPGKEVTESSRLFAENKNTRLAGKAGFLHLPVFVNQQGVIRRLGAAVFPAPFGFGNNLFALLNGGLIAVNLQPVFARFQLGFAELGDLRHTDGLGEEFLERW